jgi:putative endonuclease
MTRQRQELGKLGEDLACRELESRGHEIVERRYRTDRGELDIISTHSGVVVFVEVRTKSGEDFGDGAESITPQKQQQLVWMATDYVTRKRLENIPCRFDVVSIETTVNPPRVTVFEDAFRPGW